MIEGKQIIGYAQVADGKDTFQSMDPASGSKLEYRFFKATPAEVDAAVEKAAGAFLQYRKKTGEEKAAFLDAIADGIKSLGPQLVDLCCKETALPKARIEGERDRTVNQMKLFATLLREGSWPDARIETAIPDRTPTPKADLRSIHLPIGPVVVFGASNFPLAFSVGGGDTASALAAGCPVIVKVHSAHPATGELVGKAIQEAARITTMPDGVFSMLHGDGTVVGVRLVRHPGIKAVGLTGSFKAGKSLFDIASQRDVPIPVYAEMGSTNPVFVLPQAMKERAEKIAQGFSGSVTLGVGQFCTNPGLLFYQNTEGAGDFNRQLEQQFQKVPGGVMLTESIFRAYSQGVAHHSGIAGVDVLAQGVSTDGVNNAQPVLFRTDCDNFNAHPDLAEEVFGPTSIAVVIPAKNELLKIAQGLKGHLTATVHGTEKDLLEYRDLIEILEQKVGRVVINGFPTGVEVCHAMVHGGPFPATTDGRSTSVGTMAIYRFTRPICYQGMSQALLPPELKDENPLGIWRTVNGEQTRKSITR